jgi:integrase
MKSMGSIFQRSNGRWVGKLPLPPDPLTGIKPPPKLVYTKHTKEQAAKQDLRRKLNALIEKIEAGDMSGIYTITVEGWLEKYLKVYCGHLELTTLEGYKRYIEKHINPVLGKIKLCELKPLHIQNYYNKEREKGYSEKTILQQHRILHRAFKKAVADGMLSKNPCDFVDAPSPVEYEPTIYTEEQFITLLDKLQGHRMEAIILIAGMCGLRRGELLGLRWEDIDLEKEILHVRKNVVPTTTEGIIEKNPKTKKSARTITIPSAIIPILKELRGIGRLYTKLDGSDYNPGSVSRIFKQFLKDNGLPHIRLHDLRHFNGTMMLRHGVTEREASSRLGHSNLLQTRKYQHVLKDMDKHSADKLNKVLKPLKKKGVKSGVK